MPDPSLHGHTVFGRAQNMSLVTLVDFKCVLQDCVQYYSDCSCHVKPKGMLITNHLSIHQAMRLTTPLQQIYCVLICLFINQKGHFNYRCKSAMQSG